MSRSARRIDGLLASLQDAANNMDLANGAGYSSYEVGGYEVGQFADFLTKQGLPAQQARRMAVAAAATPGAAAELRRQMAGQGLGAEQGPKVNAGLPGNVVSAANFTITVTRPTAAIAGEALPFCLFGALDANNGYRRIVQGLLAAGTVLTSVRYGENVGRPEDLTFTYTNGANVDTIVVSCQGAPYPNILASTMTDLMNLNKVRMSISNSAITSQFDQEVNVLARDLFATNKSKNINANSFKTPMQQQSGIVDLDVLMGIDKEVTVQSKIVATAGLSVSFACFVDRFYRQNTIGWD